MKPNKIWKESEILKMIQLFLDGLSCEEVASRLNRTPAAVNNKFVKEKLHLQYPNISYSANKKHILPNNRIKQWRQHPRFKDYYVSEFGDVWSARRAIELSAFTKTKDKYPELFVKINNREQKVARLTAEAWLRLKSDEVVIHKNRKKNDNDIFNLYVCSKQEAGSLTGHLSKSLQIGYFRDNICIEVYRSVREAGRDLGISYQTVSDYAYGKVKKPKYDLRFVNTKMRVQN